MEILMKGFYLPYNKIKGYFKLRDVSNPNLDTFFKCLKTRAIIDRKHNSISNPIKISRSKENPKDCLDISVYSFHRITGYFVIVNLMKRVNNFIMSIF